MWNLPALPVACLVAMGLCAMTASGHDDKTHVEHNESVLTLIADIAGDMDFHRNGPIRTHPTSAVLCDAW
jgi:hypothetical protein